MRKFSERRKRKEPDELNKITNEFFGHVWRGKDIEMLVLCGRTEGKRSRGSQRI